MKRQRIQRLTRPAVALSCALAAGCLLAPPEQGLLRTAHAQTMAGAAGHPVDLRPRLNLEASAAREHTADL